LHGVAFSFFLFAAPQCKKQEQKNRTAAKPPPFHLFLSLQKIIFKKVIHNAPFSSVSLAPLRFPPFFLLSFSTRHPQAF
jgi:hypothetical protein